ncbi:MAG: Uma2 family endonuclease [Chloroflexota bacterium]
MTVERARRTFTVDEFQRMADVGVLRDEERVELIDGDVLEMGSITPAHAWRVTGISHALLGQLGARTLVRTQSPLVLSPRDEPLPDFVLVHHQCARDQTRHPDAADVLLLIEVSDSTVAIDRDVKIPLYGRAGVVESWLVDLVADRLMVFRDPGPDGYASIRLMRRGETVAPLSFPDVSLEVDLILG